MAGLERGGGVIGAVMSELVTKERLEVLASLAVKYVRDAEQAAEIELFDWACAGTRPCSRGGRGSRWSATGASRVS